MAEAIMGATIDLLLENLLALAKEEVGLCWNFNNNLEKLKESVVAIRELLEDAEKKQLDDNLVKRWLMKLEAVAFDADYVFDELNYHVLRKKVQRDHKMKKKVSCFFPCTNSVTFRRKMAKKIKDIKNEITSIYQEASQMGIALAGGARTKAPTNLETDSVSRDPVFVGRKDEVTKMVEMLTSSLTGEEVISVFPILGMGGLGKTTLAREVYNHGEIITHFGERIWVHVPENFDSVIVLKNTLESLMGENIDGSREVVLRKLGKRFENKRYLLVLDNVWNVDMEKWGNFITSLKGISKVKGNVIMITTRQGHVASIVKTHNVNELEVLSEDDCWFIIKEKAIGEECVPLEFETVGRNIAQRCGGLPLAAQVVGGLLRDKLIGEWISFENNQLLNIGGDGNTISQILKLSFDNLPSPSLKKCFAFCSIIPKGWWMEKDEVIQLWMAEGLLQVDEENNMEDVGNGVFNMLVNNALLQVIRRDSYGNAKRCNLHDLVHDFAFSVLNPKIPNNTSQLRYISIPSKNVSSCTPIEYAGSLRALFFSGNLSHIIISNLKCLHALIMNDEDIEELPIEIGKLISLRFLDISHTRIESLPDSIGNLYHLQTLRATKEYGREGSLKKLPNTFKYLISLRHLYIPNIIIPPGIGELTSLQTLPYFHVGDEEGCGIMELGKLKRLRGELEIHNLEKVGDKDEAMKADLCHKPNLYKLKFVWNSVSAESESEKTYNDENVLEGLQPHPNLKMLEIHGFKSKSFPIWTWRMAVREDLEGRWITFDNLLEIKLSHCKECEEVPMFGHLPRLKILYLHQLSSVTSLGSSFYGIKENEIHKEMVTVFPKLEKLELVGMENLKTWEAVHIPASVFPSLVYLKISDCRNLTSDPSSFQCLKELEIDNMESGIVLANICGSKLTSLTKLRIDGVEELVCLPSDLFNNNRDLSELVIRNCKNLTHLVPCLGGGGTSLRILEIKYCLSFEELPEDLHALNALQKLVILECPNLKSIPYQESSEGGFTSLERLEVINCSSLTNFPVHMIESCISSLRLLSLSWLGKLTNLPQVMSILPKMPRLTQLYIVGVPKSSEVVAEIESLRRLEVLGIGGSSDYSDYDFFDRILPTLQRLRELFLVGMEDWDALPDQLQHLTTLEQLYLSGFGIESLPEWVDNLSSLELLDLYRCGKLRCLPSKRAMQGLTKLVRINIYRCPLLKQNLEEKASHDSEWSKISHIPTIEVDGSLISPSAQ